MADCLFCKIVAGEIPSRKLYEDEEMLAIYDIDPQAPIHVLVIPKQHIKDCSAITPENSALVGRMFELIAKLAAQLGVSDGFRVVSNCGESAGQSVDHLHFHLLAGRNLGWPPG